MRQLKHSAWQPLSLKRLKLRMFVSASGRRATRHTTSFVNLLRVLMFFDTLFT